MKFFQRQRQLELLQTFFDQLPIWIFRLADWKLLLYWIIIILFHLVFRSIFVLLNFFFFALYPNFTVVVPIVVISWVFIILFVGLLVVIATIIISILVFIFFLFWLFLFFTFFFFFICNFFNYLSLIYFRTLKCNLTFFILVLVCIFLFYLILIFGCTLFFSRLIFVSLFRFKAYLLANFANAVIRPLQETFLIIRRKISPCISQLVHDIKSPFEVNMFCEFLLRWLPLQPVNHFNIHLVKVKSAVHMLEAAYFYWLRNFRYFDEGPGVVVGGVIVAVVVEKVAFQIDVRLLLSVVCALALVKRDVFFVEFRWLHHCWSCNGCWLFMPSSGLRGSWVRRPATLISFLACCVQGFNLLN